MFSVHLQGATTVGGGVSVATCLSLTRAKIRKCNCLIYGPVLGRLCDGVHLCLRPALSGETGYKHACCTAFKHHRGPNHRDGLNTSYAERLVRASAIVGFRLAAVGEVRLGICIQLNTPPVYLLTFNVLTACVHAHFQTRFFFFLAGTVPTRCIRLYTVYCTNTVDGPLSANSYTQSLRATVGKLGTMSRACLFTEFMMLQWNVHRGIDHDEKQAFNVNIRA